MEYLQEIFSNSIYEALERDETDEDYLSNIVMTAFEPMTPGSFPDARKSIHESEFYREEGNRAYKNGMHQVALINYNKALAYAPCGSLCLKLAYSNRSAVLFTAKEYQASKRDCITALAIDCTTPTNLIQKLEKRKALCEGHWDNVKYQKDKVIFRNYAEDYFQLKSQNNSIPCASADVDVVIESGIPKVIARRDIAAGTLVALEKAFVSWAHEPDRYISCHHCRSLDLNLFPCSGCVTALFCSKQCEDSCMAEYHSVECQIAGNIIEINFTATSILKFIIKLRNMCSSWEEFILMSYDIGYDRIKKSSVNEIFDGNKPSSMLSFKTDRHFVHGALFNSSLLCAFFLNVLQNVRFLPQDPVAKLSAMKAMAKIMMYINLYVPSTILTLATEVVSNDSICWHRHAHRGLFAFAGKLKQSCMPNLQPLALNSSLALVALEQIKAGTELTLSHIFHWLDNGITKNGRKVEMLLYRRTFCTCVVCSSSSEERMRKAEMSAAQTRAINECFTLDTCRVLGIPIRQCFGKLYKALACLGGNRLTLEYANTYNKLKELQLYVLHNKLHNVILSNEIEI